MQLLISSNEETWKEATCGSDNLFDIGNIDEQVLTRMNAVIKSYCDTNGLVVDNLTNDDLSEIIKTPEWIAIGYETRLS